MEVTKIPDEFFDRVSEKSVFFDNPENVKSLAPLHSKGAEYFDQGIESITKAINDKLKVTDLPTEIQQDFGVIMQTTKSGRITGIHHMQNHHILLESKPYFKEAFEKAGATIEDLANKIYLPDAVGKSLYPTNKSLHSGMHAEFYYKEAQKKVQRMLKEGEKESWPEAEYRKGLMDIVEPMREGLNDGTTKLNTAKTLLEKVNDQ